MKNILTIILLAASSALAETIYVAEETLGTGDGRTAENARSLQWFNTPTNWRVDSGTDRKIGPGDTVVFVGTISAEKKAIISASGLLYEPIKFKWETTDQSAVRAARMEIIQGEHTHIEFQ